MTLLDYLPRVGDIDFTLKGAELYRTIEKTIFGLADDKFWLGVEVLGQPHNFELFATTRSALDWYVEKAIPEMDVAMMSDPVRIGAWRTRWWRGFTSGWKMCIQTGKDGLEQPGMQR